jgi:hypothetical protein
VKTRHFFRLSCLFLFLSVCNSSHAGNLYIYLIGGQSNADGRAPDSSLSGSLSEYAATQTSVPIFYEGTTVTSGTYTFLKPGLSASSSVAGYPGFGPEVAFGLQMTNALQPGDEIAIIKYAAGGTNLYSNWKADGTASSTGDGSYYKLFQQTVTAGLAKINSDPSLSGFNKILSGMLWVQGESDIQNGATFAEASAYGSNLTNFISDVRLTLDDPNLPFYFSRMSSHQTSLTGTSYLANYNAVRAGEDYVAANVSGAYEIDTDTAGFTTNSDGLHFNAAGQVALGKAFANSVQSVQAVPEPSVFGFLGMFLGFLVLSRRVGKARVSTNCLS